VKTDGMSEGELGAWVFGFLAGILLMIFVAFLLFEIVPIVKFERVEEACQFAGYDTAVEDLNGVVYCADEGSLVLYEVGGD